MPLSDAYWTCVFVVVCQAVYSVDLLVVCVTRGDESLMITDCIISCLTLHSYHYLVTPLYSSTVLAVTSAAADNTLNKIGERVSGSAGRHSCHIMSKPSH